MAADVDMRFKAALDLANTTNYDGIVELQLVCEDIVMVTDYDGNGDYYDPYYSYGEGAFSAIGEWFAYVNWDAVMVWVFIIMVYAALSLVGPWVFPPALICLWFTEGNIETCSFGIWSNGYTDKDFDADGDAVDTTEEIVATE